eukprot:Colp12_sorted_trinity150504_noHs@6692
MTYRFAQWAVMCALLCMCTHAVHHSRYIDIEEDIDHWHHDGGRTQMKYNGKADGNVALQIGFSDQESWRELTPAGGVPNTGNYTIYVPKDVLPSDYYQVRIVLLPKRDTFALSSDTFTVCDRYATVGGCYACHAECIKGCSGPSPKQCTECRNVKVGSYCVPACPPGHYPDYRAICRSDALSMRLEEANATAPSVYFFDEQSNTNQPPSAMGTPVTLTVGFIVGMSVGACLLIVGSLGLAYYMYRRQQYSAARRGTLPTRELNGNPGALMLSSTLKLNDASTTIVNTL